MKNSTEELTCVDQETRLATAMSILDAINRVQAVIEFDLDGTILHANTNFLVTIGYSLDEIVGRHHRMFVDPEYAASLEYAEFWKHLTNGEFHSGEFKRQAKGGRDIWIGAM